MTDRFPMPAFPDGWFQVAYGHEVPPGEVVPLHYFGEQLICYRDSTGEVVVLDAYCPHQGADIGVGGTVEGDCVKCPFHGWLFDRTGANVEIPYARSVNRTARLRRWPAVERAGCIFVWHSTAGHPPGWELPSVPEFDDPAFVWHVPDGARWHGISPFVTTSVVWSLYAFLRTPTDYLDTVCTAIAVGGDVAVTRLIDVAAAVTDIRLEAAR